MFTVYGNDRVTKLAVISGHASQAFHADFFPRLAKYYVTSQPMNAWKNNNPAAIWELVRGNFMDQDVSEILTSCECYPELLQVW